MNRLVALLLNREINRKVSTLPWRHSTGTCYSVFYLLEGEVNPKGSRGKAEWFLKLLCYK